MDEFPTVREHDPLFDLVGWRDCPARPCMIYVIGSGDAIKVGKAVDIESRLDSLQCGNPVRLRVLFAIPGDHELETRLHRWLAPDRIHGEWFKGPTVDKALPFLRELRDKLVGAYDGGDTAPDWKGLMTWPREARHFGYRRKRKQAPVSVRHVDPAELS